MESFAGGVGGRDCFAYADTNTNSYSNADANVDSYPYPNSNTEPFSVVWRLDSNRLCNLWRQRGRAGGKRDGLDWLSL